MDPSTSEWKARIQKHEAKLSYEVDSQHEAIENQKLEFLESINKSYKTELSDLIGSLEASHRKTREATLLVLGQLYTDYDNLKKEAFNLSQKLTKTESSLDNFKDLYSEECQKSKELERKLKNTKNLLGTSMAEHTEGSKTRRKLEAKLAKTEDFLEISMTKHSEETQRSKGLEAKLEKTEKELSDTKVNLRMMTMDKNELDTISGHLEVKLKEVKSKLVKSQGELEDANEIIVHLKENQKMRVGPTVNFFKGVSIKNFPPFVCDGTLQSIVYLNVSEPIELESMGFLGPLDVDALYDVTLQVNRMAPRGNKWKIIGQAKKKVQARRQQVFHVDFDEPITLEDFATSEKNSFSNSHGFYNINYTLKGPNTQSADILDGDNNVEMVEEVDEIVFYTKWYHNHWAEIGYRKC